MPRTSTSEPIDASPYNCVGGEDAVRAICHRFYELMDELPEARACRDIHPPSLVRAEEKLFQFMSGWLGGPQLYRQKHGHPRLRQRHLAAPIGKEEIAGWIACFHQAWNELVPASPMASDLVARIDTLGWHMQNTDNSAREPRSCGACPNTTADATKARQPHTKP